MVIFQNISKILFWQGGSGRSKLACVPPWNYMGFRDSVDIRVHLDHGLLVQFVQCIPGIIYIHFPLLAVEKGSNFFQALHFCIKYLLYYNQKVMSSNLYMRHVFFGGTCIYCRFLK